MNLTDNIDKLPKWAQAEVKTLQMRLREAKNEIINLTENKESNTIAGYATPMDGEQPHYLKNNQLITFILENGSIGVKIKNGRLDVHSNNFSSYAELIVRPVVSNGLEIALIKPK